MLAIDADSLAEELDYPRLVEAMRAGHRRGVDLSERTLLSEQRGEAQVNHLLIWPAWQYGDLLGAKLVSVFPGNPFPRPSISTVYVLFDGRDGAPLASITGAQFTLRKTAADSALGASFLARHDVANLLMVGAGNQARPLIEAHCAVRPSIQTVKIWNRTSEKARHLAESLVRHGIKATVVDDLAGDVREADIICCATAATAPILDGRLLAPGTHVDLVGGFTNEMREADDETIRRASVFVDSRRFTIGQCGDISGPIAAGVISEHDIRGDLFDLCSGRHEGRRSAEEITVFKNGGGGHLDLMTARLVYDLALGRRTRGRQAR
jgi:ornithine cyclodeaminase/alanine dehydrogenase-like protein (mu-crystallin family)